MHGYIRGSPPWSCVDKLSCFTVTVGRRPCKAAAYVKDVKDVERLLSALAESASTSESFTEEVYGVELEVDEGDEDAGSVVVKKLEGLTVV